MTQDKLTKAFKISSFLDKARWGACENYNTTINFSSDDFTNDEKLLVHWMCYISDRGMPFDRIWAIGGFVYSQIVRDMNRQRNLSILNPSNPNTSYFIKKRDFSLRDHYKFKAADYDKYMFASHQVTGDNARLIDYDFESDKMPFFIPRYYPSDYKAMLYTFVVLENYGYSLIKFIISRLDRFIEDDQLVPKLIYSLFLLTYRCVGRPKSSDIDFDQFVDCSEKRKAEVLGLLDDDRFERGFQKFRRREIFELKRAWCALRDFFKSPEYRTYFYGALSEEGFDKIERLQDAALLNSFELPGDIWNSNPKFRRCLLKDTSYHERTEPMPILIRRIYEEENIDLGYPEQFDITFDLVPRMCNLNNCEICPYGLINGTCRDFERVCIMDTDKFCPIVLSSCGYRITCIGSDCTLFLLHEEN